MNKSSRPTWGEGIKSGFHGLKGVTQGVVTLYLSTCNVGISVQRRAGIATRGRNVNSTTGPVSLGSYIKMVRSHWKLVLLATLAFMTVGAGYVVLAPEVYHSTALVATGDSAASEVLGGRYKSYLDRERLLANEINFANGDEVTAGLEERFGVVPDVSVRKSDDSDTLIFTSSAPTPREAADWANAWAEEYVEARSAQALSSIDTAKAELGVRLEDLRVQRAALRQPIDVLEDRAIGTEGTELTLIQNEIRRTEAQIAPELVLIDSEIRTLSANITTLQVQSQAQAGNQGLFQTAAPPLEPDQPSLPISVALGGVIGLIIGISLALIADQMNTSIKTLDDLREAVDVPVLAVIPRPRRGMDDTAIAMITLQNPADPIASGYHQLRTSLQFTMMSQQINSVLVTSADASEGKSTSSVNLAFAMAAAGISTFLTDADYRRPKIHRLFGIPAEPGASNFLLEGGSLYETARAVEGTDGHLTVLTTGNIPPSPADFFSSGLYSKVVKSLKAEAEIVIFDGPPILPVADSVSLSTEVDAVILAVRADSTKADHLRLAVERIRQVGGNVVGTVLVGAKKSGGAYASEYHYSDAESRKYLSLPSG